MLFAENKITTLARIWIDGTMHCTPLSRTVTSRYNWNVSNNIRIQVIFVVHECKGIFINWALLLFYYQNFACDSRYYEMYLKAKVSFTWFKSSFMMENNCCWFNWQFDIIKIIIAITNCLLQVFPHNFLCIFYLFPNGRYDWTEIVSLMVLLWG